MEGCSTASTPPENDHGSTFRIAGLRSGPVHHAPLDGADCSGPAGLVGAAPMGTGAGRHSVTEPRVLAALKLGFGVAALAAAVNIVRPSGRLGHGPLPVSRPSAGGRPD